jgi:hypothetical protein
MIARRIMLAAVLACVFAAGFAGCATDPPLTQTQMDALQVRLVEASPDRAFAAASSAILDAGYTVKVSDGEWGILTAEKRQDPAVAANVAVMILSTLARNPTDMPPTYHAIAIQILPVSSGRSNVRIRPFLNGSPCACTAHDKEGRELVEQIWELMQRQLLMKEPSRASS